MSSTNEADEHVKVIIRLERDEDDYPPADHEGLWAMPLGDGLYRIDNIPFFAQGIACGDVVAAVPEDGELRFQQVVRPSGHGTLRLFVADKKEVPSVREILERHGCSSEVSHIPGLISVDVPPSAPLAELRVLLDEGAAQERWGYEEACIASPPAPSSR